MSISEVVRSIRVLSERPIDSPETLKTWNVEAAALRRAIEQRPEVTGRVPHFVWHYLADADIRFKDPAYAQSQQRQLREALAAMEQNDAV